MKITSCRLVQTVVLAITIGGMHRAVCAGDHDWIRTARVFLLDACQPPFVPRLEYDAETMVELHAHTP